MFGCLLAAALPVGAAPLDPPTPDAVAEARAIVQEMRSNPRGPYSRIRWYCNDGTVQPPVAYACRERGGGRQHAEYSAARERLAALGWRVGTIYAALSYEEAFESDPRQQRLRELPLERYLIDIDDGWVLYRGKDYRGRVQAEDEAAAGRELLQQVLDDTDWALDNFLLAREAARTIPHGKDTDLARSVRRDAVVLAEMEPAAETWRAEIHSRPGRDIVPRLEAWAAKQQREEVRTFALTLAADLDRLYGAAGRQSRIEEALGALRRSAAGADWARRIIDSRSLAPLERLQASCALLAEGRASLFAQLEAARRVSLLDAMQELESTVVVDYQQDLAGASLTRAQLVAASASLADCVFAAGLLSDRERQALKPDDDTGSMSIGRYRNIVATLKRAPGWALGTLRHSFAEALLRYTALDARAARFSDDLLRESPLFVYGAVLKTLLRDADRLSGSVTTIAGEAVPALALNPGVARGRLRIFETIDALEHSKPAFGDIVVLPETVAELSPVAGILTLGEGNALSHVQLLARNFGIPNVAIDYETVDLLRPLEGADVLLLSGTDGDVLLRAVDEAVVDLMQNGVETTPETVERIDIPLPDLDVDRVLPLKELGRQLSGRVVGPKAANLGELNRLFPGRVAPAVALPFGVYAKHLSEAGLDRRITEAFADREAGSITTAEFDALIAGVRSDVAALTLSPEIREQLESAMAQTMGEPGSYGVFVRSDTNVEDLPQFTGAGLNETIANVVGLEQQLAAVPRVWSSVLSPRALAWRSSILTNPARIYASVLLMKSVPSTKSGVLVTTNVADRTTPGLTASVAWGVGGAVAGEAAESVVILPEDTLLMSEAKTPWQRRPSPSGGVDWLPAPAGAVLTETEIDVLRELAAEVAAKYEPVLTDDGSARPWDIEFGFVDGELTLFQIRPLVERTALRPDALLRQLLPGVSKAPPMTNVPLDEVPGRQNDQND